MNKPRSLFRVTQHIISVLGLKQGQGAFVTFSSGIKGEFYVEICVFLSAIYLIAI